MLSRKGKLVLNEDFVRTISFSSFLEMSFFFIPIIICISILGPKLCRKKDKKVIIILIKPFYFAYPMNGGQYRDYIFLNHLMDYDFKLNFLKKK